MGNYLGFQNDNTNYLILQAQIDQLKEDQKRENQTNEEDKK